MLMSSSYDNKGRAPPASPRGGSLNPARVLDEMFRYAASEMRRASRPPPNMNGSRRLLRRR